MDKKGIYQTKIYGSVNEVILKYINSGQKILDVGCGTGDLGEIIKRKGNYVVGIDISEKAVEIAKTKLDEVILLDVEQEIPDLPTNYFDIIIFADVLEHLYDPLKVLVNFKIFLKDQGNLIVCVPNVANWKIRKDLFLWGKFEYQKQGILDETHIRFFTLKTLKEMVQNTSYNILAIDWCVSAFPIIHARFPKFRKSVCKLWPTVFAQQFVVVAEK
jgi:methionine biosynthesis protein MetW